MMLQKLMQKNRMLLRRLLPIRNQLQKKLLLHVLWFRLLRFQVHALMLRLET